MPQRQGFEAGQMASEHLVHDAKALSSPQPSQCAGQWPREAEQAAMRLPRRPTQEESLHSPQRNDLSSQPPESIYYPVSFFKAPIATDPELQLQPRPEQEQEQEPEPEPELKTQGRFRGLSNVSCKSKERKTKGPTDPFWRQTSSNNEGQEMMNYLRLSQCDDQRAVRLTSPAVLPLEQKASFNGRTNTSG